MTSMPPQPPSRPPFGDPPRPPFTPQPPAPPQGAPGSGYGQGPGAQRRFEPRPPKPTLRPRRVNNGLKLRSKEGPDLRSWAAQRWMRLVEGSSPGDQFAEGMQYAKLGQTRSMDVQPGIVTARVQGRMPDAYNVAVRLPRFQPEHWEQVIASMTSQARYAATLLAGELPPNIEDIFGPLGLRLFPTEPSEVAPSCTCDVFRGVAPATPQPEGAETATPVPPATPAPTAPPVPPTPTSGAPVPVGAATAGTAAGAVGGGGVGGWCKHVCCVMILLAERFGSDPFLVFTMRGMKGDELLERLAQRRSVAGAGQLPSGASPVYLPHLPGVSDMAPAPLEAALEDFWTLGPSLEQLEIPIEPPEVAHPILRRLGPSPFDPASGAKFPLVGLLATCYDVISRAALAADSANGAAPEHAEGDEPPPADPD